MKTCKRIGATLLSLVILLTYCSLPVSAAEEISAGQNVEYLEDGSYIVTTLVVEPSITRSSNTTTGKKTVTKYSISNVKQYSFTLRATFSYNGSSATATDASTSITIYQNGWQCTNRSTSKSGNRVTGNATFRNGAAVNYPTVTITCSANGVMS